MAAVAGLLFMLPILPAVHPMTIPGMRYTYVISLERWAPPSPNDLYPDPELRFGAWRYRLTYYPPRIGVGVR